MNKKEYQKIIYDWNRTEEPYLRDKTIQQLFEEQVERTPDSIAVIFEDQKLTYRQLNEKANQLAYTIREKYRDIWQIDVRSDTLIGIYIGRSIEMIIGILGILKSGAAYVPFDTADPEERLAFKINDCGCRMVLTTAASGCVKDLLFLTHAETLPLAIDAYQEGIKTTPKTNLKHINKSSDLAYVIYTSGSTGKPKGVLIEHYAVANLVACHSRLYKKGDRVIHAIPFAFDVSVEVLFSSLLNGCQLYLLKENDRKDISRISNIIDSNNINVITVPAALLASLPEKISGKIIIGGEVTDKNVMDKFCLNNILVNEYGPTETTVTSSLSYHAPPKNNNNIGKPIHNKTFYVLDNFMKPVPIGVAGELYIGGDGLARGYLNYPEETKERFVDNSFVTNDDKKKRRNLNIYKTGDIVRWLPDGNLEFIRRNDDQIKIRGFRVELGEIENTLLSVPGIKQCIVLCKEHNENKYLVAYYTIQASGYGLQASENSPCPSVSDQSDQSNKQGRFNPNVQDSATSTQYPTPKTLHLEAFLKEKLPDYMIPSFFVRLDEFPLNISGKIDRKALPAPEMRGDASNYLAPRNELEEKLCKIWQEVLGIEKVGIKDDFFQLGGNSILAIRLARQMSDLLNKEVPASSIFSKKRIKECSAATDEFKNLLKIPRCEMEKAPLSFAQKRLWYLHKHGAALAYKTPILLDLGKKASLESFKKAVAEIVERHEVLRTIFAEDKNGIYYQCPQKKVIKIQEVRCDSLKEFHSKLDESIAHSFDLTREYPLRVEIYKLKEKTFAFFDFHHVAVDGWSVDVLFNELEVLYQKYSGERDIALPGLEIQYKDFAVWHRRFVNESDLQEQMDYWKNKLSGYEELNFPADYARPTNIGYSGKNYSFEIDANTSSLLRELAKSKGTTLYNVLLGAFYILMSKYTGQKDITIGTVNANRHYPKTDKLIGFFVNTFARRFIVDENATVNDLIDSVVSESMEMQNYIDIPFEHVVDALKIKRETSRHALFNIAFAAQSFGANLKTFKAVNIGKYVKTAAFDLTLFIDDGFGNGGIEAFFNYSTSLFRKESISRIARHYVNLLKTFAENLDAEVKNVNLLLEDEYRQIVYEWNKTEAPYPKDKTIQQLFEEQVEKTPDNVAVVFEDQKLTYRELNEKANQLAHTIREKYHDIWNIEVKGDTLIGIYIERSLEMIIGILGILKSGAVYVPFDTADPEERLAFKINDCGCKMVLTSFASGCVKDLLFFVRADTIPLALDSYWNEIGKVPGDNPNHKNTSTDLAYVIYTSGSTGKPKGVCCSNLNLLNFTVHFNDKYPIPPGTRSLALTSICFDVSLFEIFTHLLAGSAIYLITNEIIQDYNKLFKYIESEKIGSAYIPPFYAKELLKYCRSSKVKPQTFKRLLFGVEPIDEKVLSGLKQLYPLCHIINAYGPTEATISCTAYEVCARASSLKAPIGKPINNTKCYVLDSNFQPASLGVPGELYIGGDGLARGYLNRPGLTKKRFIDNPFASEEDIVKGRNLRIYKTGDLVKWLPDGNLEFIGRNDDQIKIRGFRVELGEIESKLLKHPDINQCAVTLYKQPKTGTKQLCAYYVPDKSLLDFNKAESALIDKWESIYDMEYSKSSEDFSNSFLGWNSSYTNKSVPINEMLEWRDSTIKRLLLLKPSLVYEIGSGTGLIAYPLLEHIEKYFGIDFSEEAVCRLNDSFFRENVDKAWIYKARADELNKPEFLDISIDTLIINSVIQYFPDIEYLEDVLKKAVSIIDKGSIFIGDVRDYRLLQEFFTSVELFKLGNDSSGFDISSAVYNSMKNENELLVAPEYFIELSRKTPKINCVEILPKRGCYRNEMNKFRYDVIIHVDNISPKKRLTKLKWINFNADTSLGEQLKKNKSCFALHNYPNKRIVSECKAAKFLSEGNDKIIAEYDKMAQQSMNYYSIEELYDLAEKFKYQLYVSLSLMDKSCYDLIFYKSGSLHDIGDKLYKENFMNAFSGIYYNNPLRGFQKKKIPAEVLRDYLALCLPDYMIPSFFIELEQFPLNISGKINKKLLPKPKLRGDEEGYVVPGNELELKLCKIWQEVLGIDRIGIRDDFFKLGGNSILALRLVSKMNKTLKTNLKVAQLFSNTTVAKISSEISAGKLYNPLVSFGKLYPKWPNLFMIHPGAAGCEVYSTLANKLKEQFNCFGLDNYNLYNDKKIETLPALSKYYLTYIEQEAKPGQPYMLLGWSLGGTIALEIALILEKRGITNIHVILIDPILHDKYTLNQIRKRDKQKYHKALKESMIKEGHEENYIEKVIASLPAEEKIASFRFFKKLKTTKVLLFKALNKDTSIPGISDSNLRKYILKLPFNNVDKVCPMENLTKIELDCHHKNILDKHELIALRLLNG